jgi:epoxide hydrolase 4
MGFKRNGLGAPSGLLLTGLLAGVFAASVACQTKPSPKQEYVTANGVRLHYVASGEGPLVLFLHGFPEFWYAWKEQLAEFGKDHLAVAPDLRGFNLSDKPPGLDRYRYVDYLADIRALADRFSPGRKFVLVGHDIGGALSWRFATAYPDRLEKLVIINAPHPGVIARLYQTDPAQQKATQYIVMYRSAQAETTLSENNYAFLVNRVMGAAAKGAFTEEDKAAYIEAWSQAGALTGGLSYYRANPVGPSAAAQSTGPRALAGGAPTVASPSLVVNVPTLVIWGVQDRALLPQNLDGLDQFVPALTIKRIAGGSHWVVHERPAEVNAYIREFIR